MPASIQLILDKALSDQLMTQAVRENISVNKLVTNARNLYLEADKAWREGFEAMGCDLDAANVDYMLHAAREALCEE